MATATTAAGTGATAATEDGARARAQALVDDLVGMSPAVPGAVVHLVGPGLDVGAAAGFADRDSGAALTDDATFRIASNTKTFTAAAILRLVEQGSLRLDDPVGGLLGDGTRAALAGDGYDLGAITVRHLLQHTAGVFDHWGDPAYQRAVLDDPARRWTRLEQVRFAVDHGAPLAPPGQAFAYSDTGYLLLGEILERATGQRLGDAYRSLLRLDALGLGATWWEGDPAPPAAGPRAHQYWSDVDTFGFDPSFDLFGAGGIVASAGDLARFPGRSSAVRCSTTRPRWRRWSRCRPSTPGSAGPWGCSRSRSAARGAGPTAGSGARPWSPAPPRDSRRRCRSIRSRAARTSRARWSASSPTLGAGA